MADDCAYIDTSVLGAYYCPEPASAAAEDALRRVAVPVISALSEVEFCSLVSKKRRLRELSARQARAVLDLFEGHVADGFYRRLSLTTDHFAEACRLLNTSNGALRTLDALHLATAVAENIVLMTADRALVAAAKRCKGRAVLVR